MLEHEGNAGQSFQLPFVLLLEFALTLDKKRPNCSKNESFSGSAIFDFEDPQLSVPFSRRV
jgi:hypothetical protein